MVAALEVSPVNEPASWVSVADEVPVQVRANILGNIIAMLEVTRPEILRAVPAYKVLQWFGLILREKSSNASMYALSCETTCINEFWSHSWHGSTMWKIWVLLMLKNGVAACVVGSLVALFMSACFVMDFLPGIYKVPIFTRVGAEEAEMKYGLWALIGGLCSGILTLVLWPSREKVFLDRACIHQEHPTLKAEGVLNIGAILKQSKAFCLLWDPSYLSRTWCVFELSAFLKTHEHNFASNLSIHPTFFAPAIFFIVFVTYTASFVLDLCMPNSATFNYLRLAALLLYGLAFTLLFQHYWRRVFEADEQFVRFRLQATECHCCSLGHRDTHGQPMPCDKDVLFQCIREWFGSEAAFESLVRTRVRKIFMAEIIRVPLGYSLWVLSSICVVWRYVDFAATRAHGGDYEFAVAMLLCAVPWVFCLIPADVGLGATVAYHWVWRKKSRSLHVRVLYKMLASTLFLLRSQGSYFM